MKLPSPLANLVPTGRPQPEKHLDHAPASTIDVPWDALRASEAHQRAYLDDAYSRNYGAPSSRTWHEPMEKKPKTSSRDLPGLGGWLSLLKTEQRFGLALSALPREAAEAVLHTTAQHLRSSEAQAAWLKGWGWSRHGDIALLEKLCASTHEDVCGWAWWALQFLEADAKPIASRLAATAPLSEDLLRGVEKLAPEAMEILTLRLVALKTSRSSQVLAAKLFGALRDPPLPHLLELAQAPQPQVVEALVEHRWSWPTDVRLQVSDALVASPNRRHPLAAFNVLTSLSSSDQEALARSRILALGDLGSSDPAFWQAFAPYLGRHDALERLLTLAQSGPHVARKAVLDALRSYLGGHFQPNEVQAAVDALLDTRMTLAQVDTGLRVAEYRSIVLPSTVAACLQLGDTRYHARLLGVLMRASAVRQAPPRPPSPQVNTWLAGNPPGLQMFLDRGDSEAYARYAVKHGLPLDAVSDRGQTLLHRLAAQNASETAAALIQAGANPEVRDVEGKTHLDIARTRSHHAYMYRCAPEEAVQLLRAAESLASWSPQALRGLPASLFRELFRGLLQHPTQLGDFLHRGLKQHAMVLEDGGAASSGWDGILSAMFKQPVGTAQYLEPSALGNALRDAADKEAPSLDLQVTVAQWQAQGFLPATTLGRSIVFARPGSSERYVLKVQKQGEAEASLHDEANNLCVLHDFITRGGAPLRSRLPRPLGVGKLAGGSAACSELLASGTPSEAFAKLVGEREQPIAVYAYACHEDYLQYVSDPALHGVPQLWKTSTNDLFWLLDQGVAFTELSPMYHNTGGGRPDGGRYRPLNAIFNNSGAGRLHAWREATEFANLRGPSGELADVTGLALLPEASRPGNAFRETFFRHTQRQQDQLVASLRASFQAELLLTWELLLGRRAVDSKNWSQVSHELRGLYTLAARLCGRGRGLDAAAQDNLAAAVEGAVDWQRYAEQMRVFMTPEHAEHINHGSFPEHLFDLQPELGQDRAGSFDPVRGYVGIDGQSPSLGPVNGPYPIKDGEKARATIAILDQLLAAAHPLVRGPAVPALTPAEACVAAAAAGCSSSS